MERREHDIFMEMLDNPTASFDTMVTVGLTPTNTSILDKSTYKSDPWVQSIFTNSEGNFDEIAFNKVYDSANIYYNNLSKASYKDSMKKQITFHRDNIWAPQELKRSGPEFKEIKLFNSNHQVYGLNTLGKVDDPIRSIDELAQSHKVLANPTTAGDNLENAIWEDAPNDNFFGNFLDVLVLALYDTDGFHNDPITGEKVKHFKGDYKLNQDGDYFYEKLDGRDVYGRQVLNKMNVLTKDGSFWNDYDFFDSDDIKQKSVGGTVMKNLALIGSMFLPYVGPWITGFSIATLVAGLGATFGKMLTGSDNPTLSAIEGWSKSLDRLTAKTQYAQEHTWCWENYINLMGDVIGLIRELRFIFNKIPAIIKGTDVSTKAGQTAKLEELLNAKKVFTEAKIKELSQDPKSLNQLDRLINELNAVEALEAQSELQSFVKGYNKIGEILGKGYMTAITVGDTYEEAKLAGASDLDATLLTLGYAAAEYALLNTGIGELFFPELRAGRHRAEAMAKALTKLNEEAAGIKSSLSNLPKELKKDYVKKLFNIGKKIANAEYVNGAKSIPATLAAGVGEGVEEVSEELLADFSKGCFNVVKWLQGDNIRLNSFGYDFEKGSWDSSNIIDRYGMSLLGGFAGGAVTNLVTNYLQFNSIKNMTPLKAIQEMVYMARNNELDLFIKLVDKIQLGDKNLSATEFVEKDGNLIFAPGTETNNQDVFAKRAIKELAKLIQNILDANGASLPDETFLTILTLGDLRFNALHLSTTAGAFLNEFNSLSSDIIKLTNLLNLKLASSADTNGDGTVTDREKRKSQLSDDDKRIVKEIEDKLKDKLNKILDLIQGKRSYEFISTSLFEMTNELSSIFTTTTFPLYAQTVTGKKYSEIPEDEIKTLWKSYEQWKTGDGRDRIRDMASLYREISELSSKVIIEQGKKYNELYLDIQWLNNLLQSIYNAPLIEGLEFAWLELIQDIQNETVPNLELNFIFKYGSEEQINVLRELYNQIKDLDPKSEDGKAKQLDLANRVVNTITQIILDNTQLFINPILEVGFINSETKNQVNGILNNLKLIASKKYELALMEAEMSLQLESKELILLGLKLEEISNIQNQINELSSTPFEQNLNQFAISVGKDPINITQLVEKLNQMYNDASDDITQFTLDEDLLTELDNAISTIELYKASILGARTDTAGINNYYGYNATLNELAKKSEGEFPELAEIDSQTADVFVSDINTNLNKLKFLKTLFAVNQSLKLSKLDRVSAKKDLLIYKRLKNIITIPDDDKLNSWNGIKELLNVVNGMSIHELLAQAKSIKVPEKQKIDFEKEKVAMEDAIYDFFQKNQDNLKDINKLSELLNPKKLLVYTKADVLLNEDMDAVDDNSMLWWLASRAAIKSSDFYNLYKLIINPGASKPLAPIPTLEMAVFMNYASIVNGNVFTQFYKAIRLSIINDWKQKTLDLRKSTLKLLGKNEDALTSDDFADYALGIVDAPRYSNIILTEGIPGSGKTKSVFQLTVELLKKYNPELLKNVAIIHGANAKSAEDIKNNLSLKDAKVYGKEGWMKEINPSWKEYLKDSNGVYQVPESDFTITDEHEIRSTLGIKQTDNPPSLIIIDEISKFSGYDIDQIDKFAKKYGITVLAAGDFDQSGVVGAHPIKINGKKSGWTLELNRTLFIRSFKLGMSMRTDNSLKTNNLSTLLAFMLNPTTKKVDFKYYMGEDGLYGDKVYNYNHDKQSIISNIVRDLDTLIKTLKDGEKIGYIYYDKESPIYKELSKDKYSQYIDLKEGGSAQGLEALYYIIEANPESDQYLRDIYTGISRALQGSILISDLNNRTKFNSTLVLQKVKEVADNSAIVTYAKKRRSLLDSVVGSGQSIPYIPRTKEESTIKPQTPVSRGLSNGVNPTPPNQTEEYKRKKLQALKEINDAKSKMELSGISSRYDSMFSNDISYQTAMTNKSVEIKEHTDSILNEMNGCKTIDELNQVYSKYETDPSLVDIQDEIQKVIDRLTNLGKPLENSQEQNDEKKDEKKDEEVPEPLPYEDDSSPITDTDIIPEDKYLDLLDLSSLGSTTLDSDTIEEDDNIKIDMLLHTFNTFELGVLLDLNGDIIQDPQMLKARIDSINGLIKIDELLGNKPRDVESYKKQLGILRSHLFNIKNKSDLAEKIRKNLGLKNIYLTFALKSSPRISEENKAKGKLYVESLPSKFTKTAGEKTVYNGSSDARSHEWHQKSIVAIIGTEPNGDLLELPLIALSSPITLLQTKVGNNAFKAMYDRYNLLLNDGKSIHETVVTLISEFEGNSKYKEIVNLFKLYNFTDRGIEFIRDQTWTPANSLTLLGPQFVVNRGYYQETNGLGYDNNSNPREEWTTVEQLAEQADGIMTKKVLLSLDGIANTGNGVSVLIAQAGHPFVLKSFDRSLDTDEKIVDYYIKLLSDSSVPKKVLLMYVLSPKASIDLYIDNLNRIISKQPGVENIGLLFTSYKLLKKLMNYNEFTKILDKKFPGLSNKVNEAIQELDNLKDDNVAKKNLLYTPRDWTSIGIASKPEKLAGLFDGVLRSCVYNRNTLNSLIGLPNQTIVDTDALNIIKNCLNNEGIDGIYYNVKIPKTGNLKIGPFHVPIQESGYKLGDTPFRIHGKIDSYTFKGDVGWLVEGFLGSLRPLKNKQPGKPVHYFTIDGYAYLSGKSIPFESEEKKKLREIINRIKTKTGLDLSRFYEIFSLKDNNRLAADYINKMSSCLAFTIGDEIIITNQNDSLKGVVHIRDSAGNSITDISQLPKDINGVYSFKVSVYDENSIVPEKIYNAEYDGSSLSLTPIGTLQSLLPLEFKFTKAEENFKSYIENARKIFETENWFYEVNSDYKTAFGKQSLLEFEEVMKNSEKSDTIVGDLEELLSGDISPEQEGIIKELIRFEQSREEKTLGCPITINVPI